MRSQAPIFIAGPTAVGKSAVALALAERIGGEVISVDSMQVYRGMDIGTAKPSLHDRQRIPHHLIDVADLTEPFDAAQFVQLAKEATSRIEQAGRIPILCGGTGFYFSAFLHGLGASPPAHPEIRAELQQIELPALLAELELADPKMHAEIDRENRRRVVRAVEVIRATGRPYSEQRAQWEQSVDEGPNPRFFGLMRPRAELCHRIEVRVDAMFAEGLVAETEGLLQHGLAENRNALQAIGYRQVVEHLRGARSLAATVDWVKQATRQYAKRQMTWFRHQLPVHWIEIAPIESAESTAARIEALLALNPARPE
jgi:tRNA dimethylallyltransferase